MAEYIEREALLATLAMADNPFTTLDNAWDMVEQAPAADVAPVVHGKWVKAHWRNSVSCANCSICGFEAYHCDFRGAQKTYNFCPNCGAKMDLEDSHVPDSED